MVRALTDTGAMTSSAAISHVPMSDAVLPPVDMSIPPWPGSDETHDGITLHLPPSPGATPPDATAVCVHGLCGSATNWTDLAAQLATRVPGVAIDLPGFGRTEPPRHFDYSMTAHDDDVARFARG